MELSPTQVLSLRMVSLLLRPGAAHDPADVRGVVEWFGALQSQDAHSMLWSLGVRLPQFGVGEVNAALERAEALRTWPMRGTVHLVPPRDAAWMVEILGERPLAGAAARRATLGLDPATAERAVEVLAEALRGRRLTRAECLEALRAAGIGVDGQLGYHLLWYASQRGVTVMHAGIGPEQTFALLADVVPHPHRPARDEALGITAERYFRGHGPTTRQDLAGWAGITAADAKRGIAVAGSALAAVTCEGAELWCDARLVAALDVEGHPARAALRASTDDVLVLPGFDEYLLGFKDRSLMLAPEHKQAIIPGGNGVFQSTVVRAGRVIGTWKRQTLRTRVRVEVRPLVAVAAADRARVEAAFEPFGRFLGTVVEVRWV